MLALNGGKPVRSAESWPNWPVHTPDTQKALADVLGSQRWSIAGVYAGRPTREQEFSKRWAEYNGAKYCVPTTNGSSALLIALEALDVGVGDEVIVPALTWVAPATAVVNVNATPVIVDVDPHTFCLDTKAVSAAITPRTRAIIGVHLYGSMVDMDELLALSTKHGIPVIEDCAQSHGSSWLGRKAGSMGAIGVFSMHQGKPLTSGEGGATITSDPALFRRLQQLRSDGRCWLDGKPRLGHMELSEVGEVLGANYCLSEFQAALLLDALTRLDQQNRHRQENAQYLDEKLRALGGLVPMTRPPQVDRQTYYHYMIRFVLEEFGGVPVSLLGEALEAELGFWLHPPYAPLGHHPLYHPRTKRRYQLSDAHFAELDPQRFETPVAVRAHAECLVFHHSVLLGTRADMDAIVEAFAKVKLSCHELSSSRVPSMVHEKV
jgi:dTDP-4-amino-4,6-dideoxygalactose transaminase